MSDNGRHSSDPDDLLDTNLYEQGRGSLLDILRDNNRLLVMSVGVLMYCFFVFWADSLHIMAGQRQRVAAMIGGAAAGAIICLALALDVETDPYVALAGLLGLIGFGLSFLTFTFG